MNKCFRWPLALITVFLVGSASKANAAAALIQHTTAYSYGPSLSKSFGTANMAGNLIIATVFSTSTIPSVSVIDTAGNTYNLAYTLNDPTSHFVESIFYATNVAASKNTVNAAAPGNTNGYLFISEWSGIAQVQALDVTGGALGYGATPAITLNTTANNDLIYGFGLVGNGSVGVGTGFSVVSNPSGYFMDENTVQRSAGIVSVPFASKSMSGWHIVAAAFKTSSGLDSTPPSTPTNLSASASSATQVSLSWAASTDNVGVAGYRVYRGGVQIATTVGTAYSDTGLSASTTYSYTVAAYDAAGNLSRQSTSANATTLAPADTQPPSTPTGLSATVISSSAIKISWAASTDNVGVTGYKVYRGGVQVTMTTGTVYSDTGLSPSTTYSYTASAFDAAGNVSAQSAAVSATTQSVTTQPTPSGTPLVNGTWTMVPTAGFPEAIVGYDNMVYASGVKKSVMWDNYHNVTSETNQVMWAYDYATNRWDIMGLNGNFHNEELPESGHAVGMLQYAPAINSLISYCCWSGSQGYEMVHHTWLFDPVGLAGKDMQPPASPGLSPTASAAFDTAHNVYVLFNGSTWTYNYASNSWTQQTPSGTSPPSGLTFTGMTYNSGNQKIYLFGGYTGSYINDIYTYDVPSNTWTKLNISGTVPSARMYPGWAYDSTNNIFMMYGGENSTGYLYDTWIYDPAANTWSQYSGSSPTSTSPSFQRLAYDPDDNVFIMTLPGTGGYIGGGSTTYSAQTWFFRYAGTGPNVGYAGTTNPIPPSGSLNVNSNAWANEPVIASTGSALYAAWIEIGQPFDSSNGLYPHPYVKALSGTTWNSLTTSFLSLDSEFSGQDEAHAPSVAIIGTTPWVSWYKTSDSGQLTNSLYAKYWNGTSWIGGAVPPGNPASSYTTQSRSLVGGIGPQAYIAFLETDRSSYPWSTNLYVKLWNGSSWNLVGSGPLNRNPQSAANIPTADSVSMTNDGKNPIIAWTEYTKASSFQSDSNPEVYVSKWNGSTWVALGNSLNIDPINGLAYDASITYLNSQPYVAWMERTQTGNNQLYVKAWNGSAWVLVGSGSLNRNGAGWAYRASLAADGTNLYVGWAEQSAAGQKPQTYVSKWNGSSWIALGGSLNADTNNGSAERVSLAILNGEPVAAWGEVRYGSLRQIFTKEWNGTGWVSVTGSTIPASDTTPPSIPTNFSAAAMSATQINLSWTASTDNVAVAGYQVYRSGVRIGTSASTAYSDTGLSATTTYSYTVAAYDAAGNVSGQSSSASATTQTGADMQPPSAPTGLSAIVVSSAAINLSWTASTDNVGVAGYRVYRGGSQVGSATGTAYSDTGLSASTTYSYTVAAFDAAGNISAQSSPAAATTQAASTFNPLSRLPAGLGASTLTCIDQDGDGYGVGPGCLGPDADDQDSSVQTMSQAVAEWGSVRAFLSHKTYNPIRYWVISPRGNDATCTSHTWTDADPSAVTACATWAQIESLVQPGDAVFWRAGTYTERIQALYAPSGNSSAPIVYMAYPGEAVTIDNVEGIEVCAAAYTPSNRDYLTFDGFKLIYSADTTSGDRGIDICLNDHLTVRNLEITRLGRGIYGGATLTNSLIENNVIYDQELYGSHSHGIYLVSRDTPNINITVRNNILWDPGRACIQHGGRVTNYLLDGNVCYNIPSDAAAGLSLEQGVTNSIVSNNLVFNANVKPLNITTYDSNIVGNIAYDENYNMIENNTFVVPSVNWQTGAAAPTTPNIWVGANGIACSAYNVDLGHNTFTNNLLINYSNGYPLQFTSFIQDYYGTYSGNGPDPRSWAQTIVWQNNDIYMVPTNSYIMYYSNYQVTSGTPPCTMPGLIQGFYTWNQWTGLNLTTTANVSVDPLFTAYDPSWYASPQNYNFVLKPSSPVLGIGYTTSR